MRYAIIEDEKYAVDNLKSILKNLRPDYSLVAEARSVEESLVLLQKFPDLDFALMDVELVDGNCFEIFKRIRVNIPIIFTTAYDEYAIKAFKVNSIDYLLKPITPEDVETALTKLESLKGATSRNVEYLADLEKMFNKNHDHRFLIFKGDTISYIEESDIAFFFSEENYVYAYMKSGGYHITTFRNLNELTGTLDNRKYFQVARNVITSVEAISKINKYFRGRLLVTLQYGVQSMEIVVSATRRIEFLKWLGS